MKPNENDKPTWDELYMAIAVAASTKSPDPSTKHGASICDEQHRPLGFGYNGWPRGGNDDSIYPTTRPDKYKFMAHSEQNALHHCTGPINNATMYVTGVPCPRCMIDIIQSNVSKVIYGNIKSACVEGNEDYKATMLMADNHNITMTPFSGDIYKVFRVGTEYLQKKWETGSIEEMI